LNDCRLAAAVQQLQEQPERSVTEIALGCGFASSQYFATLFRRKYGVAPRAFRQNK